jgi:glycosyltransferase involved in cell wall biosynthesis
MHVLINATSARLGGGITVLRNLLPALCAEDGGSHRYTVVARAEVKSRLDPGHERVKMVTPAFGAIGLRVAWEQLALPLQSAFGRAELLFSPAGLATLAAPVPQVLMVQNFYPFDRDAIRRSTPRTRRRLWLLRELGTFSARAVRKVVFISDFARAALVPLFRLDPSRAARVHLGRDPAFSPAARAQAPALLARLGVRGPYLLSVGDFYPYKNLVELVLGFSRARAQLPPGIPLLLAGAGHDAEVMAAVRAMIVREGLEAQVKLLGQVAYEDLPALYAGASLFIFPSSCESFPNILVEGLACGAPTLSSRSGPMPEVAGDGAAYFDAFDPDDLAAAIARTFNDAALQASLRERGLAQAARYSWPSTARGLLDVFDEAAR